MYPFNYHRPSSLADAVKLAGGDEAKIMAGGITGWLDEGFELQTGAPA